MVIPYVPSLLAAFGDLGAGPGWVPAAGMDEAAEVGGDGTFSLRAQPGRVRLVALTAGRFPAVADLVVPEPSAGGAAEIVDAGTLDAAPLPTLTGTVTDAAGDPLAGALVVSDGDRGDAFVPTRTGLEGRFAAPLTDVWPSAGGAEVPVIAHDPRRSRVAEATVTVRPGGDPEPLALALEPRDYDPVPVGDAAAELAAAAGFTPGGDPAEPVALDELRGRWVLLDFRTTWCGPCRADEPVVAALADALGDRLTVVEVYDKSDSVAAVAAYLREHPAAGPVVRDAGATATAYEVSGFPTRVLVDPAGRVVEGRFPRGGRLVRTVWRAVVAGTAEITDSSE